MDGYKDGIGICLPLRFNERPIVSRDIYGFQFNANNWDVNTIDIGYYSQPKADNAPKFITKEIKGYDFYTYSCNTCIKLKTFLEKNPQWVETTYEWMIPVKEEKKKARYDGHNIERKSASIRLPNDKTISIDIPSDVTESGFLSWVNSEAEKITLQYYREEALNITFNIKKDKNVYVDGIWFKYDYIDGKVEIHDLRLGTEHFSHYKNVFNLFEPKPELLDKLKSEIESGDLEVKEIIFK